MPVACRRAQRVAASSCSTIEVALGSPGERRLLAVEARDQPVRREHLEARVLERDEAHQHVAVRSLAADLLGVDARGLIAVVAVGDQQLGAASGLVTWRSPPGR